MPITIVEKQKTKPACPSQHKTLVPLRVVTLERVPNNFQTDIDKCVQTGDIVMTMPSAWARVEGIFNCTKGSLIDKRLNECILCVRAYEVEQVILANDNEPAPIV